MSGCAWADGGRHRFRFLIPSGWSAEPRYGCGPTCPTVLVTGDGIAEDVAYLDQLGGDLVTSCARCEHAGRVGRTLTLVDVDGDGEADTSVCRSCAAMPVEHLARDLAERYGEVPA